MIFFTRHLKTHVWNQVDKSGLKTKNLDSSLCTRKLVLENKLASPGKACHVER